MKHALFNGTGHCNWRMDGVKGSKFIWFFNVTRQLYLTTLLVNLLPRNRSSPSPNPSIHPFIHHGHCINLMKYLHEETIISTIPVCTRIHCNRCFRESTSGDNSNPITLSSEQVSNVDPSTPIKDPLNIRCELEPFFNMSLARVIQLDNNKLVNYPLRGCEWRRATDQRSIRDSTLVTFTLLPSFSASLVVLKSFLLGMLSHRPRPSLRFCFTAKV